MRRSASGDSRKQDRIGGWVKDYRISVKELKPLEKQEQPRNNEWDIRANELENAVRIGRGSQPTHEAISAWRSALEDKLGGPFLPTLANDERKRAGDRLNLPWHLIAATEFDIFCARYPQGENPFDKVLYATRSADIVPPIRVFLFDWIQHRALQGLIDTESGWILFS